jgi:hypothetical protein
MVVVTAAIVISFKALVTVPEDIQVTEALLALLALDGVVVVAALTVVLAELLQVVEQVYGVRKYLLLDLAVLQFTFTLLIVAILVIQDLVTVVAVEPVVAVMETGDRHLGQLMATVRVKAALVQMEAYMAVVAVVGALAVLMAGAVVVELKAVAELFGAKTEHFQEL